MRMNSQRTAEVTQRNAPRACGRRHCAGAIKGSATLAVLACELCGCVRRRPAAHTCACACVRRRLCARSYRARHAATVHAASCVLRASALQPL